MTGFSDSSCSGSNPKKSFLCLADQKKERMIGEQRKSSRDRRRKMKKCDYFTSLAGSGRSKIIRGMLL